MTQYDIYELLQKHKGKWLSTKDIAKKLSRSSEQLSATLQGVKTFTAIKFKIKRVGGYNLGFYKYKEDEKSKLD